MKKLIIKYKSLSFEERLIITTIVTMTVSALIAAGKIIIGLFSDFILVVVGIFGIFLFVAKLQCVIGARKKTGNFKVRNALIALFLLIAGLIYILYMGRILIFEVESDSSNRFEAIATATISFFEMGLAIYGLVKTKDKGHYFRDIKIVNFVSGMTAIMTAQIALTSLSDKDTTFYNGVTGVIIGVVTVFLAIYIFFAPRISIIDREHNMYALNDPSMNKIMDMNTVQATEIMLCKSKLYRSCVYRAEVKEGIVDGHIVKLKSGFRKMHVLLKIICFILSEILIFVWLLGYIIYFFRALDLPHKLDKIMSGNGFKKIEQSNEFTTTGVLV